MQQLVIFCRRIRDRLIAPRLVPLTFTYYLPAPPKRKHGYQEKEFDEIIHSLQAEGVVLKEVIPSSHSGNNHGGLWLVCKVLAPVGKKILITPHIDSNEESILEFDEVDSPTSLQWQKNLEKND